MITVIKMIFPLVNLNILSRNFFVIVQIKPFAITRTSSYKDIFAKHIIKLLSWICSLSPAYRTLPIIRVIILEITLWHIMADPISTFIFFDTNFWKAWFRTAYMHIPGGTYLVFRITFIIDECKTPNWHPQIIEISLM